MGLGGYGPSSFSIDVPIPTDERGLVGRRCPACLGYFKLKLGTGLPTETCHCPYCGYAADISEFTTPEQEECVLSVGMRETQERILKPMMRRSGESLKGIERATSRGPIQIRVEVRDQWRSIPLALYREREVETDVTCRERRARLRRGCVRCCRKELRRRFAELLPSTPHNLFQNVEALSAALGKASERSLAEALGEEQYVSLARMFQVRHVYEHNLGVVDAEAIKKVPGLAGSEVRAGTERDRSFLQALKEAYDAVVPLLEAASSRLGKPPQHGSRPQPSKEPVSRRSRDVNPKDDRTNIFVIPFLPRLEAPPPADRYS